MWPSCETKWRVPQTSEGRHSAGTDAKSEASLFHGEEKTELEVQLSLSCFDSSMFVCK